MRVHFVRLFFEAEVPDELYAAYKREWDGFADESVAQTLIREAIAAWESEGLVLNSTEGYEVKAVDQ